jgi:NADH dehydrogenase [ubiquinone] 1 alpha subcomplex assembly factor 5
MTGTAPNIFDTRRRMATRARAVAIGTEQSFLLNHMAQELADRLACVSREFTKVLIIGPIATLADLMIDRLKIEVVHDVMLDEERLHHAPGSFDLILSAGTLDSVNDLPGALVQIRRTLKPDGLFLGILYGSGSLAALKNALVAADGDQVRPHIHPQIDLRTMSDLMTRTGYALPVVDEERLDLRYANWRQLVADIRHAGCSNAMIGRRSVVKTLPQSLDTIWKRHSDADGKVTETINFLHLSGWAPAPSQPQPARRGSGAVSLIDVLGRPDS